METISGFPVGSRRNVLLFMLAALGVLVFSAVVFRVENPSIVQHEEQERMPPGQGGKMGGMGGDMSGIAEMMKQLQANPEDVETMRSLGMSFMDMQAWERSNSFWDMILERNATDVMAMNQKGICQFELKKYPEAAEQFEKMLAIETNNHHAHFNLGILYKHFMQQPEKAKKHFQTVVDAKPEDPELLESARKELAGE